MSDSSDFTRLRFLLEFFTVMDRIIERHGSIVDTIDDFEGRNAILMCLFQAGEILNRIESSKLRSRLPVDLTYSMRNIIAYDHAAVNNRAITGVITKDIPKLKEQVVSILNTLSGE